MATKTETKAPAKPASAKPAAAAFEIKKGFPLPPRSRPEGGGASSPYILTMKALKLGKKAEDLECFDVPVNVGDHIRVEERPRAIKEEAKKINNRISGAARRVSKADPAFKFAARTIVENGNTVVRVFRIAAE